MTNSNRQIIYDAVKDRYEFAIERIKLLDDKANNLVSIASIVAALISGFAVLSVKLSNPTIVEAGAFVLFLICLGLLIASLCLSIKAYQIRSYVIVPDAVKLITHYEEATADKILEAMYLRFTLAIEGNEKKNEDKVRYVKMASWLLLGALVVFAIFVILAVAKQ